MGTLNFWLWAVQFLVAALYAGAGVVKAVRPKEWLDATMPWAEDYDGPFVKFIGIVEIAGALGMILPMWAGILPWLTPLAAFGLVVIQVLAIGVHYRRNELRQALPFNLVLLGLPLFVLWGRFGLFFGAAT